MKNEKGQALIIFALVLIFVVFPVLAWVTDQGFIYLERRRLQKIVDSACLNGAVADQNGGDAYTVITQSLLDYGLGTAWFLPHEGSGIDFVRGIEIDSGIRVRVVGPSTSILSHFLGADGWTVAAEAHCTMGFSGGALPLALKEYEGERSKILSTDDPNDYWSGPCPEHLWVTATLSIPPVEREVENCWVWGDWQVLAGDGHLPNEGDISMNGLIAPDVRCQNKGQKCTWKEYIPPAPAGAALNTLKALTMGYIYAGGYDGPEPWVGFYGGTHDYNTDVHSALIGQMEGVSNKFLAQAVAARYDVGDKVVVFVYRSGELYDGSKNFDHVEVIGYAVVELVYIDANTIAVIPFWPTLDSGVDYEDLLIDDLPKTIADVKGAGFQLYPILLPW